jgi:hypothetical protein
MVHHPALEAVPAGAQNAVGNPAQQPAVPVITGLWRLLGALVLSIVLLAGLLLITKDEPAQGTASNPSSQTAGV